MKNYEDQISNKRISFNDLSQPLQAEVLNIQQIYVAELKEKIRANAEGYINSLLNGKNRIRCLNPNHKDEKPSLSRNSKNAAELFCGSCTKKNGDVGVSYDIFQLVAWQKNLDLQTNFFEVLKECCKVTGVTWQHPLEYAMQKVVYSKTTKKKDTFTKEEIKEACKPCEKLYSDSAINLANNLPDLFTRGIGKDTLEAFNIGYCEAWINPGTKNTNNSWLPDPDKRIIIPCTNNSYRADKIPYEGQYKKLHVGPKEFFNLAALNNEEARPVFIVEGEWDALSIEELGFHAVAIQSAVMCNNFVKYCEENKPRFPLVLIPDNDKKQTGQNAFKKLQDDLIHLQLKVLIADISQVLDKNGNPVKDTNEALIANRPSLLGVLEKAEAEAKTIDSKEYNKNTCVAEYLEAIQAEIKQLALLPRTSTGFSYLDKILGGGIMEDNLYTIGGATGTGKTALCVQLARNMAKQEKDVLYFSLETHKKDIIARLVSMETWVLSNYDKEISQTMLSIKTGKTIYPFNKTSINMSRTDELIKRAWAEVASYATHLYIPSLSIGGVDAEGIAEAIREHYKATGRTPIVFIDYLQLCIFGDKSNRSDKQKVDEVVFKLKNIASGAEAKTGCPATPIICISALNRDNYTEEVNLAAFKEAASIEYTSSVAAGTQYQGADYQVKTKETAEGPVTVWENSIDHKTRLRALVKKMDEKAKAGEYQRIEFKVLKNRNGYKDKVVFDYCPKYNYFIELPEEQQKQGLALAFDDEIGEDIEAAAPATTLKGNWLRPENGNEANEQFLELYYKDLEGLTIEHMNSKQTSCTIDSTGDKVILEASRPKTKGRPWEIKITFKTAKKKAVVYALDKFDLAREEAALPEKGPEQLTLEENMF